jgi:putative intracellular protease/amidase
MAWSFTMNVLMVLTSHDRLGDTGRPTGFWLEELAAPYYELLDAGATVTLASPAGGRPPLDPSSDTPDAQTDATKRFKADDEAQARLASTVRLETVSAGDFDAVFYPGGHGPLWDMPDNPVSIALIEAFAAAGKPIAAVCHAPIALANVKSPDGSLLVMGKQVTGFSNAEEAAAGLTDVVPHLVEDVLQADGGFYSKADADFAPHVVVDGTLITGQNPASSAPAATKLIELLRG